MRHAIGLAVVVACSGRGGPAPVQQAPPADAAKPVPVLDAGPYAAFDDALAKLGLTRATGDGVSFRTKTCDGTTVATPYEGAEVQVKFGGCFRCELDGALDPVRMAEFAAALADVPLEFLRAAHVTQAAVCTRLVNELGGTYTDGLLIGGTVDAATGMFLISLEPMELTGQDIVHHELFHVFDFYTDFALYKDDPAWHALNVEPYGHSDEVLPGYLNAHARDNLREDHATTYQYLMARPDELCAGDAIVIAKAKMIRDRVAKVLGDASYLDARAPCVRD